MSDLTKQENTAKTGNGPTIEKLREECELMPFECFAGDSPLTGLHVVAERFMWEPAKPDTTDKNAITAAFLEAGLLAEGWVVESTGWPKAKEDPFYTVSLFRWDRFEISVTATTRTEALWNATVEVQRRKKEQALPNPQGKPEDLSQPKSEREQALTEVGE